jgi:hypothetical protein
MVEFVAKFIRNEKWYKVPIALIVVVPFILCLSIYHSVRMLVVSFRQQTILKLDKFGQAKRLEVEHGFKFDRERAWDGPKLLNATADGSIEKRRSQMWTTKVRTHSVITPARRISPLLLLSSPSSIALTEKSFYSPQE